MCLGRCLLALQCRPIKTHLYRHAGRWLPSMIIMWIMPARQRAEQWVVAMNYLDSTGADMSREHGSLGRDARCSIKQKKSWERRIAYLDISGNRGSPRCLVSPS